MFPIFRITVEALTKIAYYHEITLIFHNFQKGHHANIYEACQKTQADGINGKLHPI